MMIQNDNDNVEDDNEKDNNCGIEKRKTDYQSNIQLRLISVNSQCMLINTGCDSHPRETT